MSTLATHGSYGPGELSVHWGCLDPRPRREYLLWPSFSLIQSKEMMAGTQTATCGAGEVGRGGTLGTPVGAWHGCRSSPCSAWRGGRSIGAAVDPFALFLDPGLGDAWGQPSRTGPLDSVAKELGSHLLQVKPPCGEECRLGLRLLPMPGGVPFLPPLPVSR